jgi:hypothetical protein
VPRRDAVLFIHIGESFRKINKSDRRGAHSIITIMTYGCR